MRITGFKSVLLLLSWDTVLFLMSEAYIPKLTETDSDWYRSGWLCWMTLAPTRKEILQALTALVFLSVFTHVGVLTASHWKTEGYTH